jgi:hypothetical protein
MPETLWMPVLAVGLASCAATPAPVPVASPPETTAPDADAARAVTGRVELGFERTVWRDCGSDAICADPRKLGRTCWFEGPSAFWDRVTALLPAEPSWSSGVTYRFRLSIRGALRTSPPGVEGGFGHMNSYRCQMTAEEIVSLERID